MEFFALLLIVLAVILVQNWVFARWGLRDLDYRCSLSTEEAWQYDEIELVETVLNRKWLPAPWLKAEITASRDLDFAGAQSVVTDKSRFVPSFFMVRSYQKVERSWKVRCVRRGEMEIQKIVLVSTDLFGNVSLSRPVEVSAQVLVLPKPFELETMFFAPKSLTGDVVVRRNLLEDPFFRAGVREYTGREAMNQIHWNASVKEQELMVYQHDSTTSQTLTVLLNMQSRERDFSVVEDLVEACIRTCAAVLENTIPQQLPVRLMANGNITNALLQTHEGLVSTQSWGPEHVTELFRLLARLKYGITDSFDDFLMDTAQRVDSTDLVLITPYLTDAIRQFIYLRQQAGIRVKTFVLGRIADGEIPEGMDILCLREQYQEAEAAERKEAVS